MDIANLTAEMFVKWQFVVTQTCCPCTTTHAAGTFERKEVPLISSSFRMTHTINQHLLIGPDRMLVHEWALLQWDDGLKFGRSRLLAKS